MTLVYKNCGVKIMGQNFDKDCYTMKVIKVGTKKYTGWHQGYPKYKRPVSILLIDIKERYNVGDFISVSKDDFYLESVNASSGRSLKNPHEHRYTKYGFYTDAGKLKKISELKKKSRL